ncbi:hypothetical protein K438DRAFT_1965833 [Mycena galopus ATCC 62051]|nr:hypothetical protein K438DRAFT_1965833 [Mycena galopus ATCC 62051]
MPLQLTIRIEYVKWKADYLMSVERARMAQILRSDLTHFKLPHPAAASIGTPTESGIEFSYTTKYGSRLFMDVLHTFEIQKSGVRRKLFMKKDATMNSLKTLCSIEHMTLEQTEVDWRSLPNLKDRPRARSLSPPRDSYRSPRSSSPPRSRYRSPRSPSPPRNRYRSPSVNNWRRIERKPFARYNGSSDHEKRPPPKNLKWIRDKKTKLDENRVDSTERRNKAATPAQKLAVARLTREYWDTRWDLSNAAARGILLETQLLTLGADLAGSSGAQDLDFAEQIRQLELTLEDERSKCHTVEKLLEDMLRECETPVVVPQLIKLAEMCDEDECAMLGDE